MRVSRLVAAALLGVLGGLATGPASAAGNGPGHTYKLVGAPTNSPAANTQQTMTPAKQFQPPPAGPRPETDFIDATRLNSLSSDALIKRSQLFPAVPPPPGDPILAPPVLNAIGATTGGGASFQSVPGVTSDLLGTPEQPNEALPTRINQQTPSLAPTTLPLEKLHITGTDLDFAEQRRSDDTLFGWFWNVVTLVAVLAIGVWVWRRAPRGAVVALPQPQA